MRVIIILNEHDYTVSFKDDDMQYDHTIYDENGIYHHVWFKNYEYNLMFLKDLEHRGEALKKLRGYFSVNDLMNEMGIPKSIIGQVYGWIDDDIIDLNVFSSINKDFINGFNNCCIMEFDVKRIF